MTNPYSMQPNPYMTAYPQQQNYPYQEAAFPEYTPYPASYPAQKKSGPSTFGMMTLGALGGGTVGFLKNRHPVGKDGTVSDTFAKEVFEKNLKNRPESSQKFFKQLKEVLKKIDKTDSPEGFKNLLKANKEIIEEQCKGISADTFIEAVNSTNLKESKKSLKESLEGIMNFEMQKTKNAIKLGWDKETKKFVKTPEFKDNKLFDVIKNTKNNIQWKKALKYGGITAGIMGALTLGYKMLTKPRS